MGQISPGGWNQLPIVGATAGSCEPSLATAADPPVQPVPYGYSVHVSDTGFACRCRYASVAMAAVANVPFPGPA